MNQRLALQSLWLPRDENLNVAASNVNQTLHRMAALSSQWSNWWRGYKTVQDREHGPLFLMDREDLIRKELLNRQIMDANGNVIEELGYGLSASSGPAQGKGTEMSHMSLRCCSRTPPPAGFNELTIELPMKSAAPDLYEVELLSHAVLALVEIWNPDWLAVWDRLTKIVSPPWIGGPVLGWVNFIPVRTGLIEGDLPPQWQWFENRGGKQIFIFNGGSPDMSNSNHVSAFEEMAGCIRWGTPPTKPLSAISTTL